jgi:L-lysine 2,3-aminomutase
VTSVLLTGGDPMVMSTAVLRRYVEPLLALEHVTSIRFGTKALSYWPRRFLPEHTADAADLLRLFEEIRASGRHVAVMAHWSHPRELWPELARRAVRAVLDAGAAIRAQAPLIAHVNDDPAVWAELWTEQVRLGAVPYYLFVERDTGPSDYFAVPLVRAHEVFTAAYAQVSGLARTVRGPVMSATPGKVCVDGVLDVGGQRYFVLRLLQARDARLVNQPFLARFDPAARWLTDLEPVDGRHFPFERRPERTPRSGDVPDLRVG